MSIATVLTTVNAPYGEYLDGAALACCLKDPDLAKSKPGHVSSFFGELSVTAQKEFAAHFGIDEKTLVSTAKTFAAYSGQSYPIAE